MEKRFGIFVNSGEKGVEELDDDSKARMSLPSRGPKLQSLGQSSRNFGTNDTSSNRHRMADKQKMPRHVALYKQVKSLAMGEHPFSKYVPPLLLLVDALLTSLIISKVACEFPLCYFN